MCAPAGLCTARLTAVEVGVGRPITGVVDDGAGDADVVLDLVEPGGGDDGVEPPLDVHPAAASTPTDAAMAISRTRTVNRRRWPAASRRRSSSSWRCCSRWPSDHRGRGEAGLGQELAGQAFPLLDTVKPTYAIWC